MRRTFALLAILVLAGCQSGGGDTSPAPNRPVAADRARPKAKTAGSNTTQTTATPATPQTRAGWHPSWWIENPKRTGAGAVQASGTATAGELLEARRLAIDSARTSALTLADAGQRERVLQAATNPNANGSYTVWVVLEVGGN